MADGSASRSGLRDAEVGDRAVRKAPPDTAGAAGNPDGAGGAGELPPVQLTENARKVLEARYLRKKPDGTLEETPEELFWRVARTVAEGERAYGGKTDEEVGEVALRFYELMTSGRFLPNSPTLMNAGRGTGMLSACFVLPVEDSIDEIFDAVKATALIQKAGGGTGFAFDTLRPTGDYIASSGGTTSGPISFWRVFSEATNAIQQGAFRRGANMGMMNATHPDILKFIHAKQDLKQFTNYNISVKLTDEFMEVLKKDPDAPHVVVNPRNGERFLLPKGLDVAKYQIQDLPPLCPGEKPPAPVWTVSEIFELIVRHAHATGEPGVAFIDRMNEANPTPLVGRIEATNPCGEQPLLPYESCNLGSVNVAIFVRGGEGRATYDWEALRETTRLAVRFLDDVIEANHYPLPEITRMSRANRKIGLGVMGFADALYLLGVPYNSDAGAEFGRQLMKFIDDESHAMSEELAEERGVFQNWPGSTWDTRERRRMRNAATTTLAPTGTISIIAGCSSGIEPLFSLAFYRNVLDGKRLVETNEVFRRTAQRRGFHSEALMARLAEGEHLAEIPEVPEDVRRVFITAHEITPEWHIRMQAAFQEHCDSSISKTTNFPREATVDDVRKIYLMAYESRLKGVTVYRDGCRERQPMATKKKATEQEEQKALDRPIRTPTILSCLRIRQLTPFGNMHVKITVEPRTGKEREVFAQLGKGGDIASSDLEAICRMVSLYLRSGGALPRVIEQFSGIGSSLTVPSQEGRIMSLADGLARAMEKYWTVKQKFGLRKLLLGEIDLENYLRGRHSDPAGPHSGGSGRRPNGSSDSGIFKVKCPECMGVLVFEEGCVKCPNCGYSQC